LKLGPYLLMNILLVGGGIFAYDALKGEPAHGGSGGSYDYASEPIGPSAGAGGDIRARNVDRRLDGLEAALKRIETRLAAGLAARPSAPRDADPEGGEAVDPGGGGSATLPGFSGRDIVDTDNPVFDDETVKTLSAYMDEIARRKNEERQRKRIQAELDRIGVELDEALASRVVDESLAFQERARQLLTSQRFGRDEEGRAERQAAMAGIAEEYKATINRLVPSEQATLIIESRLGRGMGYFGAGGSGVRRESRRGGRSNR
jgi:hypothetical protein